MARTVGGWQQNQRGEWTWVGDPSIHGVGETQGTGFDPASGSGYDPSKAAFFPVGGQNQAPAPVTQQNNPFATFQENFGTDKSVFAKPPNAAAGAFMNQINEAPPPGVDPFAWSTRNAPIKGADIVDRSQILAERLAQRNVGPTGTALQEALRQRAQDHFGSLSEEFNARGITPQSNAFQDMLQKNLLRESREAELEQQGRRSAAEMAFGNRFLGQNLGQLAGEQEFAEMSEAEKQARKARKRRSAGSLIGGGLGAVAGGLIGGPAGVLTGAQTGASVGSDF